MLASGWHLRRKNIDRLCHVRLFSEYHCKRIYLSVVKENIIAARLYESFGFRFNGQHDIHGEHVMEL